MNYPASDIESYRDTLTTVSKTGSRLWVYAKKPHGKFANARSWVYSSLLIVFFITPFIRIAGKPLFLFNIFERKFILFGVLFWPQDFHIFLIISLIFFVFIVLFTAVYGRVFCGWVCPQTMFMEHVFRNIEYLIEGDYHTQMKNDQINDSTKTIAWRKLLKYTIFASLSFVIGNLAMSYLIGIEKLQYLISHPISQNIAPFMGVMVFSMIFFFVFTWLREQACTIVCPYGRLQSVLQTNDTLGVIYDYIRGEPRGKLNKNNPMDATKGDCIDCKLCVSVCPTGIDIRNGTQLECINCTACIDECDTVMTKIHKPNGLIRFDSVNGVQNHAPWKITPRVVLYSLLLITLVAGLAFSLATRKDIEATIKRVPGTLAQKNANGSISNLYNLQLVNKSAELFELSLTSESMPFAKISVVGDKIIVKPEQITEVVFFIELPPNTIPQNGTKIDITLNLLNGQKIVDKLKTNFLTF